LNGYCVTSLVEFLFKIWHESVKISALDMSTTWMTAVVVSLRRMRNVMELTIMRIN
jgi:hypothetical protein